MKERLTNIQVSEFLNDVKNHSETYILEEGKEKNELLQVAKARGLDIENSRDLALFKTIYAFTGKANANGAILPEKELLKVLPQIVGKPVNRNHERDAVLGHYIDYRYIDKEKKIIAYGVFYKSYYPELYDLAQDKLKLKKLSSSFEIWSPKDSQKENEDGTYELRKMEMAGGALIFEDSENEPAFKDAKVLSFANKNTEKMELVYAKYKPEEIITADVEKVKIKSLIDDLKQDDEIILKAGKFEIAVELHAENKWVRNGYCKFNEDERGYVFDEKFKIARLGRDCYVFITKDNLKDILKPEKSSETKKVEQIVTVNEVTCSNCSEKFEIGGLEANIKCPKCFAILNRQGQMIYPPQIKDFSLLCPACKVSNWLIVSHNEEKSKVRCLQCSKEYELTFKAKKDYEKAMGQLSFLYSGRATCPQCNHSVVFEGSSKLKTREFTCPSCGLVFTHNINNTNQYKTIASIKEIENKIKDNEIVQSSEKGGNEMELKDKDKQEEVVEKKEEVKATEEKVENVVEPKATDTPAEETSKEEAPKAEEKVVETPVEPKVEEKTETPAEIKEEPKAEEKEEINADIEFEKQFEKEAEYDITISRIVELVKTAHSLEIASFKVTCECLKCGKKVESTEHCNTLKCPACGGTMRRADRPGRGRERTLSKEERKSLPDSMFAVVIKAINRKTGKERKIRIYPMVDEAHVKYALKQLATKEIRQNLTKLGANFNDIRRKVIKRARKLNLKSLAESLKEEKAKVEKIKAGVNKTVKKLIEARKEKELYKENAKEIISRRKELVNFDTDLTDEDILIDEKFEKAKLEKENALLKASETKEDNIVSSNVKTSDNYTKIREEINRKAFPKI